MRTIILSILAAILTACSTMAPTEQVEAIDYGPPPTNYEARVKTLISLSLKDPDSAQFKFSEPFKGYTRKAPLSGGGIKTAGWIVRVFVNAKNSYGGYVGFREYQFLFKDDKYVQEVVRAHVWKEEWLWCPM